MHIHLFPQVGSGSKGAFLVVYVPSSLIELGQDSLSTVSLKVDLNFLALFISLSDQALALA